MTRKLFATFDGAVLRPEEPMPLAPNTRVLITVQDEDPESPQAPSFLRTARALDLNGPPDWSEKLEDYLYGTRGGADD
ncbi:MAG: hypothetical protein HY897_03255 [Deltaproteobacteria bacterium]|nr:hypothetical protein [Deltaproteobacteria bacterium]